MEFKPYQFDEITNGNKFNFINECLINIMRNVNENNVLLHFYVKEKEEVINKLQKRNQILKELIAKMEMQQSRDNEYSNGGRSPLKRNHSNSDDSAVGLTIKCEPANINNNMACTQQNFDPNKTMNTEQFLSIAADENSLMNVSITDSQELVKDFDVYIENDKENVDRNMLGLNGERLVPDALVDIGKMAVNNIKRERTRIEQKMKMNRWHQETQEHHDQTRTNWHVMHRHPVVRKNFVNNNKIKMENNNKDRDHCVKDRISAEMTTANNSCGDIPNTDDSSDFNQIGSIDLLGEMFKDTDANFDRLKRIESKKIEELKKGAHDFDFESHNDRPDKIATYRLRHLVEVPLENTTEESSKLRASTRKTTKYRSNRENVAALAPLKSETKDSCVHSRENCQECLDFSCKRMSKEKVVENVDSRLRTQLRGTQINATPDGFWDPFIRSFGADDPRNVTLIDDRFVNKR